ncbi:period circadian protein isoform X2 [Prorops nasuta]|uniref:period circadian protein isoform X2 n=1 Tax=Prorops nasuta TaxID=863751 RepID=UPI0034D02022
MKMEEASTENAKVSDSGYSNTCSNSQSQRSSGSSASRNSNRSESSGYCGGHPSTFGSSNEALPRPISKRKDKEHKKKKSKNVLVKNKETEIGLKAPRPIIPSYAVAPARPILEKKKEEATTVEFVDATNPSEHNDEIIEDHEATLASQTSFIDESSSQANEGFCLVISMHDGLVLYTTPSISKALGYPKDVWIGRSFLDYVHPKDKSTLADQITSEIALPQEDRTKGMNGRRASLFCGLRKNTRRNLQILSHKQINYRSNLYLPFHLTLSFRDFRDKAATGQQSKAMFLVVVAQPVHSAYKASEETITSSIFSTRHTATCQFSHVDPDVVQYFGYLPQDMIGRSLFDFYHPEDLPFIKDIYETILRHEGSSFRSRPYRFAAQNGSYVMIDTEWSSFINPWTNKLEFVLGQHRVLKGPKNPDVFRIPQDVDCQTECVEHISEEIIKEAKIIQDEIKTLLDESFPRTTEVSEHQVSQRRKDLASFVEGLLQEVKAPGLGKDQPINDDRSFSGSRNPLLQERDSVMLGEISPHHEYYDSKSSTETPPSYNQLNYNENIERFFKSEPPVTTMYVSDEENVNSSNEEGGKISPVSGARKCMSPINGSGTSGCDSAGNLSSGSNNQTSSASRGETSNATSNATAATESFKPPTLTESLLNRHNENMEKLMMQKHREFRSSIKNIDKLKDSRIKNVQEKSSNIQNSHQPNQNHGVKRSGSHSWEGDTFKISKQDEISKTCKAGPFTTNPETNVTKMNVDQGSGFVQPSGNFNLWSQLSVNVPSPQPRVPPQSVNSQAVPRIPIIPQMIPIYYVPVQQNRDPPATTKTPQENLGPPSTAQCSQQNPYIPYMATGMAGVIYPPMFNGPTQDAMMYRPFLIPNHTSCVANTGTESLQPMESKSNDKEGPASQATSIKAEPGSIMAMSESSKKVLSPGERFSSCISNDGVCSTVADVSTPVNKKNSRQTEFTSDSYDSSSSSFYSSALNKSSECSCNPDQQQTTPNIQQQQKRRKEPPWLEDVQLTPELIYEYQIHPKTLKEVLEGDVDALKNINQPLLVNDQLGQLYLDLELEGFGTKLILEDGITSSGSDSSSSNGSWTGAASQHRQARRMMKYGKLVMIHEENAPLPPPLPTQQPLSCQQS